jgi:hypothetical protein
MSVKEQKPVEVGGDLITAEFLFGKNGPFNLWFEQSKLLTLAFLDGPQALKEDLLPQEFEPEAVELLRKRFDNRMEEISSRLKEGGSIARTMAKKGEAGFIRHILGLSKDKSAAELGIKAVHRFSDQGLLVVECEDDRLLEALSIELKHAYKTKEQLIAEGVSDLPVGFMSLLDPQRFAASKRSIPGGIKAGEVRVMIMAGGVSKESFLHELSELKTQRLIQIQQELQTQAVDKKFLRSQHLAAIFPDKKLSRWQIRQELAEEGLSPLQQRALAHLIANLERGRSLDQVFQLDTSGLNLDQLTLDQERQLLALKSLRPMVSSLVSWLQTKFSDQKELVGQVSANFLQIAGLNWQRFSSLVSQHFPVDFASFNLKADDLAPWSFESGFADAFYVENGLLDDNYIIEPYHFARDGQGQITAAETQGSTPLWQVFPNKFGISSIDRLLIDKKLARGGQKYVFVALEIDSRGKETGRRFLVRHGYKAPVSGFKTADLIDSFKREQEILKAVNGKNKATSALIARATNQRGFTVRKSDSQLLDVPDFVNVDLVEFCGGSTVGDLIDPFFQVQPQRCVDLVKNCMQKLQTVYNCCQEQGLDYVLNSDLSPWQWVVRFDNPDEVSLVDLGGFVKSGEVSNGVGRYTAPELLGAKTFTTRNETAEIYSLGWTMYALLAGKELDEAPLDEFGASQDTQDVSILLELSGKAPKPLINWVQKACAIDSEQRFQSFAEATEALDKIKLPKQKTSRVTSRLTVPLLHYIRQHPEQAVS